MDICLPELAQTETEPTETFVVGGLAVLLVIVWAERYVRGLSGTR